MDIVNQSQQVVPNAVPNLPPIQEPAQFKIPETSSSKFPTGFVVVLLLVVVLGFGVYLGRNYLPSSNIFSKPTPTPTVAVASPSAMPTVDPTANWKIYRNTAFQYELKYPNDWAIAIKGDADEATFPAPYFNSQCNNDKGDICSQILISTSLFDEKNIYEPNFIINSTGQNPDKVSNEKMIKVGGVEAKSFDFWQSNYARGDGKFGRLLNVVVFNNGKTKFTITYEESQMGNEIKSSVDRKNINIFDQILSTFKFTEKIAIRPTIGEGNIMRGIIKGYYSTIPRDWFDEKVTCGGLVVMGGDNNLIDYFTKKVKDGNTVNIITSDNHLFMNLDLKNQPDLKKNKIQNSSNANLVEVEVQEKKVSGGSEASSCYSFVEILSVK